MQKASFYRPELDGLRFAAFLMVFLHHTLPREVDHLPGWDPWIASLLVSGANAFGFGMTLFFLLSAFLITRLLTQELAVTGRVRVIDFYARRALRIWPLYAFAVFIGIMAIGAPNIAEQRQMFGWFSVFLGNWFFLDHPWNFNVMDPLWSISVEEQFYLVLPLAVLVAGRARLLALGLLACALGLGSQWIQGSRHFAVDTAIWANTTTHFTAFGAGIVLAAVTYDRPVVLAPLQRIAFGLAGGTAFFVAAYVFEGKYIGDARSGIGVMAGHGLAALGASALLLAVLDIDRRPPAWLLHLGRISFGLYVYHLLMMTVADTVIGGPRSLRAVFALVGTMAVASFSYVLLERPFLMLRERFVQVANRPI